MFNISHIDHVVLDTSDLDKCVHFYVQAFSMHAISWKDSVALRFGSQKINIHPVGQNISPWQGPQTLVERFSRYRLKGTTRWPI